MWNEECGMWNEKCALNIRLVPDLGLSAGGGNGLIAYLEDEVTLFEGPLAVGTYEGEFLCRKLEGDCLHLAWL